MSKKMPAPAIPPAKLEKVPSTASSEKFEKERYLQSEIKASGLDQVLPIELSPDCDKADRTKVWTELMIGLAYVESSWNTNSHNAKDHNNTPSTGLFQMTGVDVYYKTALDKKNYTNGVECFSSHEETRNEEKNIHCAVWKMKELMNDGTSLKKNASNYWGPFKSDQYKKNGKGGALVEFVKQACQEGDLNKKSVGSSENLVNNNIEHWSQLHGYTPYRVPARAIPVAEEKEERKSRRKFSRSHK